MAGDPFDFRELLSARSGPVASALKPDAALIIGASVSEVGLALVALPAEERRGTCLSSYANVVVGPIEQDWSYVASLVRQLPEIVDPHLSACVYLRAASTGSLMHMRVLDELRRAFPGAVKNVPSDNVVQWLAANAPSIRMPDIPEHDRWCEDLVRSAAETALFAQFTDAERTPGRRQRQCNDLETSRSAGPLAQPPAAIMTAVNYSKPHVFIVTLTCDQGGQLRLDAEKCASFIFDDRGAVATRRLQDKVARFVSEFEIRRMAIRTGPSGGPYAHPALAYKAEAVIEGVGPRTVLLSNVSVGSWSSKHRHLLPEPQDLGCDAAWRRGQARAIETAAYALLSEKAPREGDWQ